MISPIIFSEALARAEPITLVATQVYSPESDGFDRTISKEPPGRLERELIGLVLEPVEEEERREGGARRKKRWRRRKRGKRKRGER